MLLSLGSVSMRRSGCEIRLEDLAVRIGNVSGVGTEDGREKRWQVMSEWKDARPLKYLRYLTERTVSLTVLLFTVNFVDTPWTW